MGVLMARAVFDLRSSGSSEFTAVHGATGGAGIQRSRGRQSRSEMREEAGQPENGARTRVNYQRCVD